MMLLKAACRGKHAKSYIQKNHAYLSCARNTVWNMPKYEVFSGPNAGKYGPQKTLYLDIFHAVKVNSSTKRFYWNRYE